jgi:hypothetical protein
MLLHAMAIRTARGIVRSVKIFDSNRKGEIILRTGVDPNVDVSLKLSNDNDSAFCAMSAVVSVALEFGDATNPAQAPNLHVKYDDSDMEIDELQFHWH